MLATEIFEKSEHVVFGYRHDRSLTGLRNRLSKAPKFILDPNAVAMAAGVALSKPTSILASLAFTRLPADPVWIEFANADVREAMARLGSPNKKVANSVSIIERSGFLLRTDNDDNLLIEYAHRDRIPSGQVLLDVAPVVAKFDMAGFDDDKREMILSLARAFKSETAPEKIADGKVQQHLKLMHTDPREAAADEELRSRLSWLHNPDLIQFKEILIGQMGQAEVSKIEENQGGELMRLFQLMVLPALILLNCRNAVDIERVPAPEKLNKQRVKKGKPPIQEHSVVKIHLSNTRRRVYETHGHNASVARGALVIGHFKVRKNGIFWWSPHWRGTTLDGPGSRTYMVTS